MNVSDYRRDYAAYCSAVELAHYQHRAGFERELNLEPIYDRYGDLFTRDAIDNLEHACRETSEQRETERTSLNKLIAVARAGYLDARARELTDELARCTSAASVTWNDESVPVNNIPKIISNEAVAARRRELTARWTDALRDCDDLRAARFENFHESARTLGFDSYHALLSDITGVDYERLAAATRQFLARTESAYTSALARAVARDLPGVSFDDLQYADYFYFRRMTRLDPFFPAQELMATYSAAMADLGIHVERQSNIHIDDVDRPFKNPRAACFRIKPPDDVRLLIAPVGGASDYTVLFHEAGHAQHFAWSSRDLVKRYPEFLYAPDYATTEGYAFLLSHLFLDAEWLVEHLGGVGLARARAIVRDLALLVCANVRRCCGSLAYEIALHESSDLRSEQLSAAYRDALSQATGFRRDARLYLTEVDDGFYSAAYLRAWAFEAALSEYLRTRYGRRWWAARKCGDELIDLWNTSSRYTVEELARLIGFGEISFELLADNLRAAMRED
jgi:oligoendopeptidase F